MFERILVALDGSPTGEEVLPFVRRLIRIEDSEIILARAPYIVAAEPYAGLYEAEMKESCAYLSRIERRLAEEGIRVRCVAKHDRPAEFILRTAQEQGVRLIALSTHGRSGVSRALFGSVAEEVLRRSPVPVFVVRAGGEGEPRPLRTILVPLDGSERGLKAWEPAVDLARACAARLVLLYSHVPEAEPAVPSPQGFLERLGQHARAAGIAARHVLDSGHPGRAILRAIQAYEADLVAMATHGRSGIERMVTGSVTEFVLRRSSVPLLVVRSTEEVREKGAA